MTADKYKTDLTLPLVSAAKGIKKQQRALRFETITTGTIQLRTKSLLPALTG